MAKLTPGIVAVIMVSGSVIFMAANTLHRLKQHNFGQPAAIKPKKKVRFSDSVVEPKSDNREFRRLHRSRMLSSSPSSSSDSGDDPPAPEDIMATASENIEVPAPVLEISPALGVDRRPISKKVEALVGSNLPANRIALYANRYHDRLLKV